jgi:hypothetical protein
MWWSGVIGGGNTNMRRASSLSTKLPNGRVSTVFLGTNTELCGPPLVYETMIFGGPLDQEQERYASRAEAIAGHTRMIDRLLKLSLLSS